jgi:hypothetical protein
MKLRHSKKNILNRIRFKMRQTGLKIKYYLTLAMNSKSPIMTFSVQKTLSFELKIKKSAKQTFKFMQFLLFSYKKGFLGRNNKRYTLKLISCI